MLSKIDVEARILHFNCGIYEVAGGTRLFITESQKVITLGHITEDDLVKAYQFGFDDAEDWRDRLADGSLDEEDEPEYPNNLYYNGGEDEGAD